MVNKLDDFLNHNAIWRYKTPLLSADNSILFIELCKSEKIKILGIDTFLLYPDNRIRPVMAESIDYSINKDYRNNWNRAKKFILSKNNKAYYYEIVADTLSLSK